MSLFAAFPKTSVLSRHHQALFNAIRFPYIKARLDGEDNNFQENPRMIKL